MKFTIKTLSVLFTALLVVGMVSCDDDPDIGDADGIPVGNGIYITQEGVDPVAGQQLKAEVVEAADFGVQDREGYVTNYVYLVSGSYNLVEVTNRAITSTMGGTSSTVTDEAPDKSGCDKNTYGLVSGVADGGNAFNVSPTGLYKVAYDETTGEVVFHKIDVANVIGAATPNGWGSDTDVAVSGTATEDGITYEATDVVLRPGEWKVRFNCRWKIDRRIDTGASPSHEASNGYVILTNVGGTLDNLVIGGANFVVADGEDGRYTVTVGWSSDGWTIATELTEALEPISFVPGDFQWGIIGAATPTGWDSDTDLNYEGVDGTTYKWEIASIALIEGSFKFRANDAWDNELNFDNVTLTGDIDNISADGNNFALAAAGAGDYKITITTSDDGANYTVNLTKL